MVLQQTLPLPKNEASADLRAHNQVQLLPPADVFDTLALVKRSGVRVKAIMLDPWYNKGVGGVREDYDEFVSRLLHTSASLTEHMYLWGYPEIVARFLEKIPAGFELVAWLTWYYKNCPSVIRGWRTSQFACLHIARKGAQLYPEHFLNEVQLQKKAEGKLRYMPGPTSVIEEPLLVGFVGRKEQTGHPSQKPVRVFEQLLLMVTRRNDIVLDPMCGSGTTGEACLRLGRRAILCDASEEYTVLTERRLGVSRGFLAPWQV